MTEELAQASDSPDAPQHGSSAMQHMLEVRTESQFSGPLPPPEILAKYNKVLAGAADRIISMAEQQSAHRQALERMAVEAGIRDGEAARLWQRRGQTLGFTIAILAIGGGSAAAIWSPNIAGQVSGGVIGGTALVSLVALFVRGPNGSARTQQHRASQNESRSVD